MKGRMEEEPWGGKELEADLSRPSSLPPGPLQEAPSLQRSLLLLHLLPPPPQPKPRPHKGCPHTRRSSPSDLTPVKRLHLLVQRDHLVGFGNSLRFLHWIRRRTERGVGSWVGAGSHPCYRRQRGDREGGGRRGMAGLAHLLEDDWGYAEVFG